MKTSELWNAKNKKGFHVKLHNGWYADVIGAARGTTTLCKVYGIETECGSVYTHDIVAYMDVNGVWQRDLEFTPAQKNCAQMVSVMGW